MQKLILIFLAIISMQLSATSDNAATGTTDTQTIPISAKNKYFQKTGDGTYVLTRTDNTMNGITIAAGRLKIDLTIDTTNLNTEIQFQRSGGTSPKSISILPQVLETTKSLTISTVTKNDSISSYTLQKGDVINGTYNASYTIDSTHGPVDAPIGTVVTFADTIAPALGTKLTITNLQGTGDLRIGKADFPAYMSGNDDPLTLPAANPIPYPKGVTGSVEVLSALPAGNYTVTDGKLTLNPQITSATGTITVEEQAILDCSKGVTRQHLPSGTLTLKAGTNPNSCATILLSSGTFDKAITIS